MFDEPLPDCGADARRGRALQRVRGTGRKPVPLEKAHAIPRLGELLVASGVLTSDALREALARQRRSGRLLGVELVKGGYVAPGRIRRALRLQRWMALTAVAAVVAVGAAQSGSALAGAGRGEMSVTLVVPPLAVAEVEHQASELRLTEADIARGYVDVHEGSRLAIRTTSRVGYVLEFHARLPLFRSVSVTSPAGRSEFGREGGTLVARGAVGSRVATRLSYRFHLDAKVRPGAYPWPLAVSVRPL